MGRQCFQEVLKLTNMKRLVAFKRNRAKSIVFEVARPMTDMIGVVAMAVLVMMLSFPMNMVPVVAGRLKIAFRFK